MQKLIEKTPRAVALLYSWLRCWASICWRRSCLTLLASLSPCLLETWVDFGIGGVNSKFWHCYQWRQMRVHYLTSSQGWLRCIVGHWCQRQVLVTMSGIFLDLGLQCGPLGAEAAIFRCKTFTICLRFLMVSCQWWCTTLIVFIANSSSPLLHKGSVPVGARGIGMVKLTVGISTGPWYWIGYTAETTSLYSTARDKLLDNIPMFIPFSR